MIAVIIKNENRHLSKYQNKWEKELLIVMVKNFLLKPEILIFTN